MSCIAKTNDFELSLIERKLTIESAYNGTSIASLIKKDEKTIVKSIVFMLMRTAKNFSSTYGIDQATMLAFDVIDIHRTENIEDIANMLKMGRTGLLSSKFDKLRFDNSIILNTWIPKYLDLKADFRERVKHKQKVKLNAMDKTPEPILDDSNKIDWSKIKAQIKRKEKTPPMDQLKKPSFEDQLKYYEDYAPTFKDFQLVSIVDYWKTNVVRYEEFCGPIIKEIENRKKEGLWTLD